MKSTLRITLFSFLILFFIPNLTCAETKTFIKEYTYQASEFDSKASCRIIAIEQLRRLLLEELGTYLESLTEVKNFELTKDKITALTAGVVQTRILEEKWDGRNYWLKAEIKANPSYIIKSIDNLRKDQKKSQDLEQVKNKLDESLKEIELLTHEMAGIKKDIKAREKYNKSVESLKNTKTNFGAHFLTLVQGDLDKRWIFYTMGENGSRGFYDSTTLLYVTKNTVRVWGKVLFIEGEEKDEGLKNYKEMDTLYEINCSQKKFRIISIVAWWWDDNIIIDDEPTAWLTVSPESTIEDLSKIVCRKTKRK